MPLKIRPFTYKFFLFLLGFSVVMSWAIVLKESTRENGVEFIETLIWQSTIWLPWILAPFVIERVFDVVEPFSKLNKLFVIGLLVAGLLILHFSIYFGFSNLLSPLLDMPDTRFGVYRYFFIFWGFIDLVLIWGLLVRLGVPDLVSDPVQHTKPPVISVKKGIGTILLKPEEIKWISAEDYYAKLHTIQGGFLIRKPLKILMRELPKDKFIQVHRSTIVNVSHVSETLKDEMGNSFLVLNDGEKRAISRQGLKRFNLALNGA